METSKNILRKELRQIRDCICEETRKEKSQLLTTLLLQQDEYKNCTNLLLYASFGSEVDTFSIAQKAIADGKLLFFPKVQGENMHFYQVSSSEELITGYHGILEPPEHILWNEAQVNESLLIMPGLGFDRARNRIGYGKGFYDRFLHDLDEKNYWLASIALCFQEQLLNNIPATSYDRKPDKILTERGYYI